MQYILSQEEFDKLQPKYKDNSKEYISTLRNRLDSLQKEHSELKNKYNKLLYSISGKNDQVLDESKFDIRNKSNIFN